MPTTLSDLMARCTAGDLADPLMPDIDADTPIREIGRAWRSVDRPPPKKGGAFQPLPHTTEPVDSGPTSWSAVTRDGVIVGYVDPQTLIGMLLHSTLGDLEIVDPEQFEKPVEEVAIDPDDLPKIEASVPAMEAVISFLQQEIRVAVIMKDDRPVGYMSFRLLLRPAFSLPLLGLLLELEQSVLRRVEDRAAEAMEALSESRISKTRTVADQWILREAKSIEGAESMRRSRSSLDSFLKKAFFPEEHDEQLERDLDRYGAPAATCIHFTNFVDKGTMMRKLGLSSSPKTRKDNDRFWSKAESVRNALAHGRAWWEELRSRRELEEFIASINETMHELAVEPSSGS